MKGTLLTSSINNIFRAWLPPVLYMALIWVLSSIPMNLHYVSLFPMKDKGVHLIEYAILGGLNSYALFRSWPQFKPITLCFLASFLTVFWGVCDEIHQSFVPRRTSSLDDLYADTVGALIGVVAYLLWQIYRRRSFNPPSK